MIKKVLTKGNLLSMGSMIVLFCVTALFAQNNSLTTDVTSTGDQSGLGATIWGLWNNYILHVLQVIIVIVMGIGIFKLVFTDNHHDKLGGWGKIIMEAVGLLLLSNLGTVLGWLGITIG